MARQSIKSTHELTFQSLGEFGTQVSKVPSGICAEYDQKSWAGESRAESLDYLQNGNTKLVQAAEDLIAKLDSQISLERADWHNDVSGAFPDIPAYCAGIPENMRARQVEQRDNTPIKIYVGLFGSAGINHETMSNRGAAILALAIQLAKIRQVEIWGVMHGDGGSQEDAVIKIKFANPLVLSEACWMLTSQGITRNLGMSLFKHLWDWDGRWGRMEFNEACNALPTDLCFPPLRSSTSVYDPKNLVNWVNTEINKFKNLQDE